MELALNLGWVIVAAWMTCAWLRVSPRGARERHAQFVALAVIILILLPAISMTDDLLAAQNPAEADCCVRRDHDAARSHSIVPVTTAFPMPELAQPTSGIAHLRAPNCEPTPTLAVPLFDSIQNRPPPAA